MAAGEQIPLQSMAQTCTGGLPLKEVRMNHGPCKCVPFNIQGCIAQTAEDVYSP